MTVLKFVLPTAFRHPSDAADYFRFGAEYIVDVSREMGYEVDDLPERVENATDAMRADLTDVDDDVARLIAVVLVGDAEFYRAFVRWFPWKYRVFALGSGLDYAFRRKLRRLGAMYVGAETGWGEWARGYPGLLEEPTDFTARDDEAVLVDGRPAMDHVDGYPNRVVLTDAVLHTEWYEHAARYAGVDVEEELVDRTVEESAPYFAGVTDELSDDVAEFQRALFIDAQWLRDVNDAYDLDSWACTRAAEAIDIAVEDL